MLSHPNLVQFYGYVPKNHGCYFVLRRYKSSLAKYIQNNTFTPSHKEKVNNKIILFIIPFN